MLSSIPKRIKKFNSGRIPEFLKLKYKMMSQNSFRFFRGTCHLFYEDLHKAKKINHSPKTWICGDLHLENFGSYKGDNRLVYFDLNDFDEAILAPASWEILRVVTSLIIALQTLKMNRTEVRELCKSFLEEYRMILVRGKARYLEIETSRGEVKKFLETVILRKEKEILAPRTVVKKNKLVFRLDNKRLFPVEKKLKLHLYRQMNLWLTRNKHLHFQYKILDIAARVAGTGSVGLRRYEFLLESDSKPIKYLLIDMKEACASSLAGKTGVRQPKWKSEADRVISVQERMQNVSPALLSAISFQNRAFVIKEMQPIADKIDFMAISGIGRIRRIIKDMALLTASAQLRSAGREGSDNIDELIRFGAEKDWTKKVLDYANNYASKVQKDYNSFLKAYQSGFFD